jgi:hypothetical protein
MQANTAFVLRNSIQQGVRWILPSLVLVLVAFLSSARPALAQNSSPICVPVNYQQNGVYLCAIWKPVEVHLVFNDANGKQQDYSLAEAPPDVLSMLPLPLQAESKFPLLNPKVLYLDGQWLANRDTICKEVVANVQHAMPAGHDNEAYNVSCRPFKYGFMSIGIDPMAASYFTQYNSQGAVVTPAGGGGYPTNKVRQLQITLSVPLNIVPFTVTSPCTCKTPHNILGATSCNKDPDFTMSFEVTFNVVANSTALDAWKFGPKPQMKTEYYAGMDGLGWTDGKAYEVQVAQLESKLEQQLAGVVVTLAATGDLSVVAVVGELIYDLFKYGIGGLYEATCDSNLYNTVDAYLSGEYNTTTIAKMANQASAAFNDLFLALDTASAVGFTDLEIEGVGDEKKYQTALQFRLIYPPPAKPKLENAAAALNKGIHLTPPSIGTGGQQVKPGVPFLVSGSNFQLAYTNQLDISWDKTVFGIAKSQLEWGPKGGTMQPFSIPAVTGYRTPATLKPGTAYQFHVKECDTITCSPWSDWFETSTESSGSGTVKLWLDDNTAQTIGTAPLGAGGGVVITATIPAGTAAGTQTLNAATTGNTPEASAQITVAGGSGVGATIAVMNTTTHTAYAPPLPPFSYPNTLSLRGDGFAPGVTVTVYLDTPTGPKLGTAVPNAAGIFLGNIKLPSTTPGSHQLLAVQGTIQASEAVTLEEPPK